MIRRTLLALVAASGAAAVSACAPQTIYVPQPVPQPVACDTRFTVVNNSSMTVMQLFFSHSSINTWGADQLGQNVLRPGQSWNYRAANAGDYDFRVVYANGRAAEIRRVDICRASRILVTNSGLYAQ